jgi:hypothetical protein
MAGGEKGTTAIMGGQSEMRKPGKMKTPRMKMMQQACTKFWKPKSFRSITNGQQIIYPMSG